MSEGTRQISKTLDFTQMENLAFTGHTFIMSQKSNSSVSPSCHVSIVSKIIMCRFRVELWYHLKSANSAIASPNKQ